MASPVRRRSACAIALAAALTFSLGSPAEAAPDRAATTRWSSTAELSKGDARGVAVSDGAVRISKPAGTMTYADPYGSKSPKKYSYGTWTSPWVGTSFDARTIIPSWNVKVPTGGWVRVEMRGRTSSGTGTWDQIADWGYGSSGVNKASYSSQPDDFASVNVDTVSLNGNSRYREWQIKVWLMRPPSSTQTPVVESIGAAAASYATRSIATTKTTMTADKDLAVPGLSQMIHRGQHPQWGGGGENWCSPTSIAMILRYHKAGPAPSHYSWSRYADSQVNHAARYTYDHRYKANGNWSFGTAYASQYGLDSFVTRLYDLREAESFIKAGIPLVVSVKFGKGGLSGAPISSTNGHLMVVRGFTKSGSVIAADPAAPSNSSVRRVYSRSQFEKAWLGGSGGVAYVIRPATKALPADTPRW